MIDYKLIKVIFRIISSGIAVSLIIVFISFVISSGIISILHSDFGRSILTTHLQEYQSANHAAILIKCIFFAFDCLDHVRVDVAIAICIIPVLITVIIFGLM